MTPFFSLTEINDRTAKSAEQDQTSRICRPILPFTLRKIMHGLEGKDKGDF